MEEQKRFGRRDWLAIVASILIALAIVHVADCEAAGFLEVQERLRPDQDPQTVFLLGASKGLSEHFSICGFALVMEEAWAEAYGGLAWFPAKWIKISAGAGIETAEEPWRVATSLFLKKGRYSLYGGYERGGSGWWAKSVARAGLGQHFALGGFYQRFYGVGPYFETSFQVAKLPVTVWAAPTWDWEAEEAKAIVAVKFKF